MAKLAALGVRCLRCLMDVTPDVEIKPLTLLVGRNGAGKSTFARLFPLLRQSAERRKRSPILWFGNLVDFGSFSEAVARGYKSIELSFSLSEVKYGSVRRGRSGRIHGRVDLDAVRVILTLEAGGGQGADTSVRNVKVQMPDTELSISFTSQVLESISVDGFELKLDPSSVLVQQGSIIPTLIFLRKDDADRYTSGQPPWSDLPMELFDVSAEDNELLSSVVASLPIASGDALRKVIYDIDAGPKLNRQLQLIAQDEFMLRGLQSRLVLASVDVILEALDEALNIAAMGVRYLKPLRATASRYHRAVDLAVAEIDPEGANLPAYLASLHEYYRNEFNSWLNEFFGIRIDVQKEAGQIKLMAQGPNDAAMSNLADMGFGLSQVLPIAAQLWAAIDGGHPKNRAESTRTFVIEQPELHLHPAYQATLADVFTHSAKAIPNSAFVIETHSPHMINRFGRLVEAGKLSANDISVVLFDVDHKNRGVSIVKVANFDSDGTLVKWPYGFFEAEN